MALHPAEVDQLISAFENRLERHAANALASPLDDSFLERIEALRRKSLEEMRSMRQSGV
jgi:hypothetical protein